MTVSSPGKMARVNPSPMWSAGTLRQMRSWGPLETFRRQTEGTHEFQEAAGDIVAGRHDAAGGSGARTGLGAALVPKSDTDGDPERQHRERHRPGRRGGD